MSSSEKEASASESEPTPEGWHILIVDDEPDVHAATRLAVKRRTWLKRPFILRGVSSAKEAQELLLNGDYRNQLQVAIVDVVMETQFAGLDLCRFLRSELPRSVRIILRTGQAGVAPEERIINEYDIDFYFAKTEATADRLYMALRTCLRSSQDIATLLAFGNQLRSFTTALQKMTSRADLVRFMRVGLDFLELKHSAQILFVSDIDTNLPGETGLSTSEGRTVAKAFEVGLESGKLHPASKLGIEGPGVVLTFASNVEGSTARGGFVVQAPSSSLHDLHNDLTLFVQNWAVALGGLLAQRRRAAVGALTELAYLDRIGGIATVLLGAGRRIEGSITAAAITSSKLSSVGAQVTETLAAESGQPDQQERIGDLFLQVRNHIGSLDRHLATAKHVVRSFEQVSQVQLRDVRISISLADFVRGCVDLIARTDGLTINVAAAPSSLPWTGYPGSLAHVLIKLLEGAIRHAYPDEVGTIDVRILEDEAGYCIEVEDYGSGAVPPEVISRLADFTEERLPTTVGLKLSVASNIVTQRLLGRMTCTSVEGVGTKFQIFLPRAVPPARPSGEIRLEAAAFTEEATDAKPRSPVRR